MLENKRNINVQINTKSMNYINVKIKYRQIHPSRLSKG